MRRYPLTHNHANTNCRPSHSYPHTSPSPSHYPHAYLWSTDANTNCCP